MLSASKTTAVPAPKTLDSKAARAAVKVLRERVKESCAILPSVPDKHNGDDYKNAALNYATEMATIRKRYAPDIFAAAKEITELCKKEKEAKKDWTQNKEILNLWHNLAKFVVERLSERADVEKVGALLLSQNGDLLFFETNRVPDGIEKQGDYLVEKIRKTYGFCAEKNLFRRALKVHLRDRNHRNTYKRRWEILSVENLLYYLGKDIVAAGRKNRDIKNCYVLTTAPPCNSCQETIAAIRPKGVIAADRYLGFSRGEEMAKAESYFVKNKIRFISLRQIECV
ncbi:MAG: hypothetical protein WC464_06905 [Bdellovibrionales bacterium]